VSVVGFFSDVNSLWEIKFDRILSLALNNTVRFCCVCVCVATGGVAMEGMLAIGSRRVIQCYSAVQRGVIDHCGCLLLRVGGVHWCNDGVGLV
jgi:hypothetical protein